MSAAPTLEWLSELIAAADIPYMLVGSFASSAHGVPRTTQDIDVVIDPTRQQLVTFLAAIDAERFHVDADVAHDALRRRGMFNIIDMTTGWKLDLVIRKATPHAIEELARRAPGVIAGVNVPVASAEDVIIAKLAWARDSGSERQLGDVAGIVAACGAALDRAYLERWIRDLALERVWTTAQAMGR